MAFNSIVGTTGSDNKTTTPAGDVVLLSSGDDVVNADFQSVDYIIGGSGQDTLISSFSYESFTIAAHTGIQGAYIVRYTGTGGKANIIKEIETFQFAERTISLQDFIDGIDDQETVIVDGHGTIDNPEAMNASSNDFLYKDDLTKTNFVTISDFSDGDKIEILAAQGDIISITNDGEDVIITNNSSNASGEIVSSITLLGVVSADNHISDVSTFEQAIRFDAIQITVA